ncbi:MULTISPECIES: long-chain fatty acid--CoA ligase [unclassified Rothia (in: high G+C Gram-positive bacteria)]|uniref:long-chain fatty acid--CoA ligase n=1 Tax=unclassified Rothia (in: high G+C Gram-positive bacteria) TaxID=2689056 RepID=UPI0019569594|nr:MULTISPECIES: long-chain fatty acid--CoA ligase [unclassified Rothia (in: high G+C Gram-positive bacteria)]MBM7052267.1 long-chain fatty acid--CoA ligase [Rothia sp. ZJ1223]QRZ61532.1 long-chain fatty acid--CoA ligase [Rothia sp. ZJ932]
MSGKGFAGSDIHPELPEQPSDGFKPDVTNPANLAPVDPTEKREEREDIKAAILETKLRRWALLAFIVMPALYVIWQQFFA